MSKISPRALSKGLLLLAPVLLGMLILPGSASAQTDPVFELAELTAPPRFVNMDRTVEQIRQAYPPNLRSLGVSGRVQLEAIVGSDGKVETGSVKILFTEHPQLGEAAQRVAGNFGFRPGEKEGRAVRARVVIPVVFQP